MGAPEFINSESDAGRLGVMQDLFLGTSQQQAFSVNRESNGLKSDKST
jgi:hypothetical protein